jgi:hypothetical protein
VQDYTIEVYVCSPRCGLGKKLGIEAAFELAELIPGASELQTLIEWKGACGQSRSKT